MKNIIEKLFWWPLVTVLFLCFLGVVITLLTYESIGIKGGFRWLSAPSKNIDCLSELATDIQEIDDYDVNVDIEEEWGNLPQ